MKKKFKNGDFSEKKIKKTDIYKMKVIYRLNYVCFLLILGILFFSCVSMPIGEKETCSRHLTAKGIKSAQQLTDFFLSVNNTKSEKEIKELAFLYIREAKDEGINSDCAFVQMCLETGFLRFGNLVTPEMHNYCGLGAIDSANPGLWFPSAEIGVRAHIQHLQAYATTQSVSLKKELVDPRYSWVHKTKYAETIFDLAGQWATDPKYGEKLDSLLTKLEEY